MKTYSLFFSVAAALLISIPAYADSPIKKPGNPANRPLTKGQTVQTTEPGLAAHDTGKNQLINSKAASEVSKLFGHHRPTESNWKSATDK